MKGVLNTVINDPEVHAAQVVCIVKNAVIVAMSQDSWTTKQYGKPTSITKYS